MGAFNDDLRLVGGLYPADDLRLYIEGSCQLDKAGSTSLVCITFQAVSHIKYLIHFSPGGIRFGLNESKKRWGGKQIVFHGSKPLQKTQHFCLASPCTMYEAGQTVILLANKLTQEGQIGAGRRKQQLAHLVFPVAYIHLIAKILAAREYDLCRTTRIKAFGIFQGIGMIEYIVPGRCCNHPRKWPAQKRPTPRSHLLFLCH